MANGPDKTIIARALSAKRFIREAGEGGISDEFLIRASVTYGMLERKGWLVLSDEFDMAHAIALMAHNFDDVVPSTPERAVLFSAELGR